MTLVSCSVCQRSNKSHRGYCGGCGSSLQPVCRGCRFVNEVKDRFCGGCGSGLVVEARGAPTPQQHHEPEPTVAGNEISELFVPVIEVPDEVLPAANITQADLDRLFGAV
ncbi:MAG: zinc ribbon domain-containing protein [Kofleriaceae bacterium]